tara:strand:+ start:499 stop:1410 length:912 start_codon:yes stop_codon:yes gene_type:complete
MPKNKRVEGRENIIDSPFNQIALKKRDIKIKKAQIRANRNTGIAETFSRKRNTLRVIDPSSKKASSVIIGGHISELSGAPSEKTTGYGGTTVTGTAGVTMKGKRKQYDKHVTGRDKKGRETGYTVITKYNKKGKAKVRTTKSTKAFERANIVASVPGKRGTRGGLQRTLLKEVKNIPQHKYDSNEDYWNTHIPGEDPRIRDNKTLRKQIKTLKKGGIDASTDEFVKGIKQFKKDVKFKKQGLETKDYAHTRVAAPYVKSGTINRHEEKEKLARKNYKKFGTATGTQLQQLKPKMLRKKRKNYA